MNNPYQAPTAASAESLAADDQPFYVVSPSKYWLLMLGTVGLYQVYWFYRNWAAQNAIERRYWPVMRAIFAVFFTHGLFTRVAARLQDQGAMPAFNGGVLATGYVILAIFSHVLGRLAYKGIGSPLTDLLSLILIFPIAWVLFRAQLAVNAACGDPMGEGNCLITGANIAWLLAGAVFWLLSLFGLYAAAVGLA